MQTRHVSAFMCFTIVAASMNSAIPSLLSLPAELQNWVSAPSFDAIAQRIAYVAIIIFLGMLLDSISIILIVLPIFIPLFNQVGANLVWLGILSIITGEIGLLTHPLGIAVAVVKGCLPDNHISLENIFLGAIPFGLIMLIVVFLAVMA